MRNSSRRAGSPRAMTFFLTNSETSIFACAAYLRVDLQSQVQGGAADSSSTRSMRMSPSTSTCPLPRNLPIKRHWRQSRRLHIPSQALTQSRRQMGVQDRRSAPVAPGAIRVGLASAVVDQVPPPGSIEERLASSFVCARLPTISTRRGRLRQREYDRAAAPGQPMRVTLTYDDFADLYIGAWSV